MGVQTKLRELKHVQEDRNDKLREKFSMVENKATGYDASLVDFMTAKREQNEYK